MALTDEQRERIRQYARVLQGDPGATPTQPLPPPTVPLGQPPERDDVTQPLRTPPPPQPEPRAARRQANPPNRGKATLRAFVRHLGRWDNQVGGSVPTPGGIGWLVAALLFLIFAVVAFNGYTRLQWIWMSLTGAATLPAVNVGGGASGGSAQQVQNAIDTGIAIGIGAPPAAVAPIATGIGIGIGLPGGGFTPVR